jgi:hypothetical protein
MALSLELARSMEGRTPAEVTRRNRSIELGNSGAFTEEIEQKDNQDRPLVADFRQQFRGGHPV